MKKIIISTLFLLAFNSNLLARQSSKAPFLEKDTWGVLMVNEELPFYKKSEDCLTICIPICNDGEVVGYVTATFCGDALEDLFKYETLDSFEC